jgi:O-antigen/teichoic acid export membrane protein
MGAPSLTDSPEDDDLRARTVRNVGWVIVEKWGVRLVTLGVFTILTRTVSSESFGLISIVTIFTAILAVFVDAGFSKSLVQRKGLTDLDIVTAFWTSNVIALVAYLIVFFSAPLLETLFDADGLTLVLRIMGISLLIASTSSIPAALLERAMLFRTLAFRNLVGTFSGALVAVPLALLGAGIWAIVAQALATSTAAAIALWARSTWRPKFRYSKVSLRKMAGFGSSVIGIELLNVIAANVDKLIIGLFFGVGPLGLYYVAQRVLNIITELITTVIGKLALTTFSRLQDDRARFSRGFLQLTFASSAVAIPVFGIVAILGYEILPVLFGAKWEGAVPLMQILAISAAFTSLVYFDKNALLASGNPGRAFRLALVENVVGIGLLLATGPFGLIAVAFGRAARLIVVWPYRLTLVRRYIGVDIKRYLLNIMSTLVALLPAGVVYFLFKLTPWPDVNPQFVLYTAPTALLMLIIYGVTLWFICGQGNREIIKRSLRTIRRRK